MEDVLSRKASAPSSPRNALSSTSSAGSMGRNMQSK